MYMYMYKHTYMCIYVHISVSDIDEDVVVGSTPATGNYALILYFIFSV
jgi:hypothetical protein